MRTITLLTGLLLVAILATPALAEPGERGKEPGKRAEAKALQHRIQKLTKELKKLEKQLQKAQRADEPTRPRAAPEARATPEQRMAEARRRLAGLLAERGRAGRPPQPPRPPEAPRMRRGAPDRAEGPAWMGALRRLSEGHQRLAARVQTMEHQIRRIGAAIGRLDGGKRAKAAKPKKGRGAARQGHGPKARGGQARGRAQRGRGSIEARLARLERAVRMLVARERGGGRMQARGGHQGPRWMRGHGQRRGPDGMRARGPRRGPHGMGARGPRPAMRGHGGPGWMQGRGGPGRQAFGRGGPQAPPFDGPPPADGGPCPHCGH